LTKLDISNNSIEQGEALQQIIEYCNTKGILHQIESPKHHPKESAQGRVPQSQSDLPQ
jgi:hypothetical protein